jgi:phosphatidylserine/phosphatidylglycerophosphate/cardiolipin synthase-like enzyme
LLASKLVNFDGSETDEERRLMVIALVIATFGIDNLALPLAQLIGKGVTFRTGVILKVAAILLIIAAHPIFIDKITDLLDGSKEVMEALTPDDPQTPRYALWSRYLSQFSDNPAASQTAGGAFDDLLRVKRIGVWHSKMQLVSLPVAGSVPAYIGYLGGIDINDNRVESWAHRWPADYHDIHARVIGPAVADLFQSFYERYAHEQEHRRPEDGPAAPNTCPCVVPKPGDSNAIQLALPIESSGDDIVQIARTIYRPSTANAADAYWFAPEGEASVHDSVLRAIHSAREYIYIEDQFMAPPDSGGTGDEIIEALIAAAEHCKALIMVFPEGTGDKQWMFGVERRDWLMGRLRDAWRLHDHHRFLPLIHARPLLDRTDQVASLRRTVLKQDITAGATQIQVVDGIRVPEAPCWAWISGELMLVDLVDLDTLSGAATLTVERGTQGRHLTDSWARNHAAGAPVTFARFDDVFIHAKIVLIDDVFASIGSTNMNRRSMFHDGEISAQIVPGRLRAAAANPVRDMRCRVWADHLGIPPGAATAALADPLDALSLFERTRAAGNTLLPYLLLDDMKPQGMAVERENAIQVLGTIFAGLGQVTGDLVRRTVYSTVIDPTTSLDPFFDADPFTGP